MEFGAEGADFFDFFVEFGAGGAGNVCFFLEFGRRRRPDFFWFNFLEFGAEGAVFFGFFFWNFRPPKAADFFFGILKTLKKHCS